MTLAQHLQVVFLPFLVLSLTLVLSADDFKSLKNIRRYQLMAVSVLLVIAVDIFSWYLLDKPQAFPLPLLWSVNSLYFVLTELIAYQWFLYVVHQARGDALSSRDLLLLKLAALPSAFICVMIIFSPWTRQIFYIDPLTHDYYRGSLHFLQMTFGFIYLIAASVVAYCQSRRAVLTEERRECRFLCLVVVFPLVGGVLQMIMYELVLLWPCTAVSAFLMFMDFQSHLISSDPLTSLNNRGTLERFLLNKARDNKLSGYLFMVDIDRFKSINDRYGHIEGDRAIKTVAQALSATFGALGGFVSRYGGDEFVAVSDVSEPESVVSALNSELAGHAAQQKLPYELTISSGYALCEHAAVSSLENVIKTADDMMYERKRKKSSWI